MILTFGEFELDVDRYELRENGQTRKIEPKVFDLIAHFASHPEQVFSRDDLVAAVWPGRVVSDATVSTCIKNARRALGDSGEMQRYIKTVRSRGFRFEVGVEDGVARSDANSTAETADAARWRGQSPSLLVVPFRSLSNDPDSARLAEGLSSDLGTILTRIPLLQLSAETSKYVDREITPSVREIHEDLGVDYVLEGKIQQRAGHYRINVQLSDAKSGFRLWGEQFSVPGPADHALEQAVTVIIAKLEPQLHRAIYEAVRAAEGESNAQALYLEASGILALKGWHHDTFAAAAGLLRKSGELDPEFALAPAYLSLVMGLGDRIGFLSNRQRNRVESLEAAERALGLDGMSSTVLGFAGCALADIGYPDRALPILRNAVEINPANAQAWAALGSVCLITLRIEEAVAHLTHGIKISPLDSRLSIWGSMLALALMQSNDLEGALREAELACQRDHRSYLPRVVLAGLHLLRKDRAQALQTLNDARRIKPDLAPPQIVSLVGRQLGGQLLELD